MSNDAVLVMVVVTFEDYLSTEGVEEQFTGSPYFKLSNSTFLVKQKESSQSVIKVMDYAEQHNGTVMIATLSSTMLSPNHPALHLVEATVGPLRLVKRPVEKDDLTPPPPPK